MISDFVFYTAEEVANFLKMHLLTIYEYIRNGELKAIRIGRTYRIARHDLSEFIRRHAIHMN